MSIFGFGNGECKRCHLDGKCEVQKVLAKDISILVHKINTEMEDDSIVGTVIVTCNRGGE